MPLRKWWDQATELPGDPRSRGLRVTVEAWSRCASDVAASGGRLLSMWASADVYAAFLTDPGVLILELPVDRTAGAAADGSDYPSLETLFPCASRMQRAMLDLSGVRSSDPDQRGWLRRPSEGYAFLQVSGEGVHEIAVGPVHAGTIEPGHFRF